MRYTNHRGWVDIDDLCYQHPANVVIRDLDIDSYRKIIEAADLWEARGKMRSVYYETAAGVKYAMDLVPYRHPTGALTVTLGTITYDAQGVATYTPGAGIEGALLTETGVLIPNPSLSRNVAGMLLTDYYYHLDDALDTYESHRVTQIVEGDFLWLVRRGDVYLKSTTAVDIGKMVMASTTVAGNVEASGDLNTGGTIADYNTSVLKNVLGDALPREARGLAIARETIAAPGLVRSHLLLPPRYTRTH